MRRKHRVDYGEISGTPVGEPAANEGEHFMICPGCKQRFDMRDLGQVFDHAGPLPHPVAGHG